MMLDNILKAKKLRLAESKKEIPLYRMEMLAENEDNTANKSFYESINKKYDLSIIGEIKKASPSKGIIRNDFDPCGIATIYEKAGIDAISVLTEKDYFLGDEAYPRLISQYSKLPMLRKDFLFDPWQIFQSKVLGVQAILLIAAILDKDELTYLYRLATKLKLDTLVEVHDEEELSKVLDMGVRIIGINNRNLHDFSVDIERTQRLIKSIPKDILIVSESGIDKTNVNFLKEMGANAVLVGEAFMKSENIINAVIEFREAYA